MASQAGRHDWADESPMMKRYYKERGINAGAFNKWWSMPQLDRTAMTQAAKKSGYESGLQFLAIQGQVRTYTNKRITPATSPREAARKLLRGTGRRDARRRVLPKLFDFSAFDRLAWTEFLSA